MPFPNFEPLYTPGARFQFKRDHMTARKGELVVVTTVGALIGFKPAPGSEREYAFALLPKDVPSILERCYTVEEVRKSQVPTPKAQDAHRKPFGGRYFDPAGQ